MRLKDLPPEERPRERLLEVGPEKLSTAELIAILLGSGIRGRSALHLAQEILAQSGSLRKLLDQGVAGLERIPGVKRAKAVQLVAALELGRRLWREMREARPVVTSAAEAVALLLEELRHRPVEHFVVLVLDTRHHVLDLVHLAVGTADEALVSPREVFAEVLRRRGRKVILAHNHPSGDPTPSAEDVLLTRRLVEAGKLLDVEVVDHIVVGADGYVSLRESGRW
ncbi:MAG: DNA repair protein RadC [Brockia lithotrophica]|nr:DNA repair protein RadC [Brockia lithotrophica]